MFGTFAPLLLSLDPTLSPCSSYPAPVPSVPTQTGFSYYVVNILLPNGFSGRHRGKFLYVTVCRFSVYDKES